MERNRRLDYVDLKDSTESDSVSTTPLSTPQLETRETVKTTTPEESYGSAADRCSASVQLPNIGMRSVSGIDRFGANSGAAPILTLPPPPSTAPPPPLYGLSPKLEMRLALNRDILGDEDLISYSPPTDLTSILGQDLSTYHRMSGKDVIMNRIITRVNSYSSIPAAAAKYSSPTPQPSSSSSTSNSLPLKNGTSSSYQQNNSKMDTPTPSRRKAQDPATWNSFGSVDREEKTLSDLERLARREKVYCMTQLNQNGSHLKHTASFNKSKTSKLFNFLSRRNSENTLHGLWSSSRDSGDEVPTCHSDSSRMNSPRKDNDKSLDRRFWKQLSKRRRGSLHEVTANGS